MSTDNDRDLDELRSLPRSSEAPPALEERVVGALRARHLIRGDEEHDERLPAADLKPSLPGRGFSRRWVLAASLLLALVAGWLARGMVLPPRESGAPAGAGAERRYLVLLSEPRDLETTKPIEELVSEYRAWATSLADAGRLVSAARLEHDGLRLASAPSGDIVRQEADWRSATGYFVIRASSYAEATELVADCPHLAYGGEISLRKLANGA